MYDNSGIERFHGNNKIQQIKLLKIKKNFSFLFVIFMTSLAATCRVKYPCLYKSASL